MIKVVNLRTCKDWGKVGDVKIDRTTPYGNPFIMKNNTPSERMRVIIEFDNWLSNQSTFFTEELYTARRLGCWCHPQPCHGDVIIRYIEINRRK
jgi:hypothetical protein